MALVEEHKFFGADMKKVLFIGEINVDIMMGGLESFPVLDREISCSSFELTIGSSTAICSCAYASLGGDASFLGLAGSDEYGDFMVSGMKKFGINTSLIRRTDKVKTGVTVNLIYEGTRTQVTYPGTIAEFGTAYIDLSMIEGFDHIHLAGLYLQDNFLPGVEDVLKYAKNHGIGTSLDPQWDESEGWKFMDKWMPRLDYLFVNEDEALSITGAGNPSQACEELVAVTACPVVKIGAAGALLWSGNRVLKVPGLKADVVDTTGAGDSFDAGFIYATLENGLSREDAALFANASGARSCEFVGGVNARSSCRQVMGFLESQGLEIKNKS